MNWLKIFTYAGIIEVFVVPHVLPCVLSFIPVHINDKIQYSFSLISGFIPPVKINVQSDVFFKIWKEKGIMMDAVERTSKLLPDFKSQNSVGTKSRNASDGSSLRSDSTAIDEFSQSEGCPPCVSPNAFSQLEGINSKPSSSKEQQQELKTGNEERRSSSNVFGLSFDELATTTQQGTQNVSANSKSKGGCREGAAPISGVSSSPQLSERSELFSRSCSAEYQLKSVNYDERMDARLRDGDVIMSYSHGTDESNIEECSSHPSFAKSCSLEYATVLKTPAKSSPGELVCEDTAFAESLLISETYPAILQSVQVEHEQMWKSFDEFSDLGPLSKPMLFGNTSLLSPSSLDDLLPHCFGQNLQNF